MVGPMTLYQAARSLNYKKPLGSMIMESNKCLQLNPVFCPLCIQTLSTRTALYLSDELDQLRDRVRTVVSEVDLR